MSEWRRYGDEKPGWGVAVVVKPRRATMERVCYRGGLEGRYWMRNVWEWWCTTHPDDLWRPWTPEDAKEASDAA